MITAEELQGIEFLRHLGPEHLNQIVRLSHLKEFAEETVVFHQGQDTPFLYIVLSGKVGLQVEETDGTSVEVARLGPGELLGWSPVLGQHAMTATAHAVTPCRLACLDAGQILDLCEHEPRFGVAFLRQIARVLSDRLWGARRNLARALSHRSLVVGPVEGSD